MTGKPKTYASAEAFRAALEAKAQKDSSDAGIDLAIIRRARAFEAFLLRVRPSRQPIVLKGGFAMYVRYSAFARPTRDLDMAMKGDAKLPPEQIKRNMAHMLRTVASIELSDFFSFVVGDSISDLGAGREFDGWRFPVEAKVGSRRFDVFHIDMTVGDAVLEPLDTLSVGSTLAFAGVEAGEIETIRVAQHYSEKLHAYVRDRGGKENSRVKDLFDMVFFIKKGIEPNVVGMVIGTVFALCGGPLVPDELEPPPRAWKTPFETMAKDNGLEISFEDAFKAVAQFHQEMRNSQI